MSEQESTAAKQHKRRFTNKFKADVMQWHFKQHIVSIHSTSKQFGVDRKTIKLWIAQRESIAKLSAGGVYGVLTLAFNTSADVTKRDQKSTHAPKQKFKAEQIDLPLAEWVRSERAASRAVSRTSITRKALAMNSALGGDSEFQASHGWLESFLNR
jgi:hypothetical protein